MRVVAQFGFMEKPNIVEILRDAEEFGCKFEPPERTTYFLSREELLPGQLARIFAAVAAAGVRAEIQRRSAQVIAELLRPAVGPGRRIGARLEI